MYIDDVTKDVMVDRDGGVHRRFDISKRTRMMKELVPADDESGAKSITPEEPTVRNDSVSSQWTKIFEQGSGKKLKKKNTNYLKKYHGSSWSREKGT